MNCRRVNSLLSAYLDAELTGMEMLGIREHLKHCPTCQQDYESLQETKRLVASLAFKAPRAELEALLLVHAAQASQPLSSRWAAQVNRLLGGFMVQGFLRPRPLAATALLSVAGLWMATGVLDRSEGLNAPGGMMPPLLVGGSGVEAGSPTFTAGAGSNNTNVYATASAFAPVRPVLTPAGFSTRSASPQSMWAEGNNNLASPAMLVTASRAIFSPR